ncbi:hypothetical protein Ssed_2964 [Shewanella sediminis HAW-EB3]|uniref:Glycosyl transferase family 1 domain-containing protein n=1 Tax=Shewanella sediminis (strain HAW-EB3) TaxID=425104 RepID=A8FXJ8_SHESH|nr:glycosyltransferase family 4 protein [Shewanella sediminis]ABV37571.1 hypothetical protein Ssed_2964 [Shewanella sediminis HAW-EB3]
MNILLVTNMYPSEGDVSWRGSFVKEQVDMSQTHNKDINYDIVHIKGRVCGGSNLNYLLAPLLILKKMLFNKFDAIHCHHAFCVLVSSLFFNKIIYTVHEGELNNHKTSIFIKLAISLSNKVIFVNHAEFLKSTHKRKYFLPCGIDFSFFKSSDLAPNGCILFPADPNRVEKNASLLREAEAVITADYPNVKFIYGGKIPREEMPYLMRQSLLVVTIGKFESDGLVLKEAMASNVPVVSTDVGNASYYLNEQSGLICSANTESLTAATLKILGDRESYLRGRERLSSLHVDQEKTVTKLAKIYQS